MYMVFQSDASVHRKGFKAEHSTGKCQHTRKALAAGLRDIMRTSIDASGSQTSAIDDVNQRGEKSRCVHAIALSTLRKELSRISRRFITIVLEHVKETYLVYLEAPLGAYRDRLHCTVYFTC